MKVSVNAIRFLNEHYSSAGEPAPKGVDDLAQKIGAQLGAIEEVIPFGKRFEGVVIVRVISCVDHPNADRLHVCKIDDGGRVQGVERDENGHVQVVCGAPNVREGLMVAWLPPGSTVPVTYDKDPFVLESRALRGEMSNGMLASPKELSLGDNHDGILEIDGDVAPGTLFVDAYHLKDDVVLDIENKMFTHRPDLFGWLGIAREIEGIYHREYKSPEWYRVDAEVPRVEADDLQLTVRNEIPELVPRFTAIAMRDVKIGPSPVWLQVALARAGIRPINNIVDYTNYFMLLTGQPLHAYDYDKVKALSKGEGAAIVVRHPRAGEKIALLNGKEIEPRAEAIMIATDDRLIGVGGVMGGADTEVDDTTRNIIIEVANFDMYSIRRTSMAHGLFTDAVTRFNKGQSPLQNRAVLAKIVDEIRQFAEGKVASPLIDDNHLPSEVMERASLYPPIEVKVDFILQRLGMKDLGSSQIITLLKNVEMEVEAVPFGAIKVTAPFWRTDIEIPEDIVEEVGRLYGFDHLPLELPKRDITPAPRNALLETKNRMRDLLSKAGANEILSYSFVHGNLLEKTGQDKSRAFELSNALSPDLQYYRLSLTPSLLEKVHPNIKAGYDEFALFEIGKVHSLTETDEEGLPREFERVAFVFAADDKAAKAKYAGAPYYEARTYLETLLRKMNVAGKVTFERLDGVDFGEHALMAQLAATFEPKRSAVVRGSEGKIYGVVGEYRASVRKGLKLPAFSAGFEVGLSLLQQAAQAEYVPLPRFPKVEQDISLRVPADRSYGEVYKLLSESLEQSRPEQTLLRINPVDIYQRANDSEHKQITLRVTIASYERTMTAEEVNAMLDRSAEAAKQAIGAERI